MGRHKQARSGPVTRYRLIAVTCVLLLAAAGYLAVTELFGQQTRKGVAIAPTPSPGAGSSCSAKAPVRIVAASGIAPVLREVAATACVPVQLTTSDSESAAKLLATGAADVWIPDSRERGYLAVGPGVMADPAVAISPIVLAAAPATAAAIRAQAPPSWAMLLQASKLAPLKVNVQDPATSGVSLVLAGTLSGIGTQATGGDGYLGTAAAAQAIAGFGSVQPSAVANVGPTQLDLVERRLLGTAGQQPSSAIVEMSEGLPYLDYPWVTGAPPAGAVAAAEKALLAALDGPVGSAARAKYGLLDPGVKQVALTTGGTARPLLPHVGAVDVPTSFAIAETTQKQARALVVLDVSGSMGDATPGHVAPIDAVRTSAATFFGAFGSRTSLGLWEFGSQLNPPKDYQVVFPVVPYAQSQALVNKELASLQAIQTGTALYNTTLAAYQDSVRNWAANEVNLVIVFTDGRNQDAPGSLDLPALLAKLKATADPARPVQMVFFGYGNADIAAMKSITAVTGGGVYPIAHDGDIVGAFIRALGQIVLAESTR